MGITIESVLAEPRRLCLIPDDASHPDDEVGAFLERRIRRFTDALVGASGVSAVASVSRNCCLDLFANIGLSPTFQPTNSLFLAH